MQITDTYKNNNSTQQYELCNGVISFGNFKVYRGDYEGNIVINFYDLDVVVQQRIVFNKEEFKRLIDDMNNFIKE